MSWVKDATDWVDAAVDIAKAEINDSKDAFAPSQNPVDVAGELGKERGEAAADADITDGRSDGQVVDDRGRQEVASEFEQQAHLNDFIAWEAGQQDVNLPSPGDRGALTFFEVALTPSTANLGEKSYFEARDSFVSEYETAYHEALREEFDDRLEQHFEVPAEAAQVDSGHSAAASASSAPAIDTPAAALDYNSSLDSGSHDGGSGSFGGSSGSDSSGNDSGGSN